MTKLIFCFDGTFNSPEDMSENTTDQSMTNILKLHLFLGGQLLLPQTMSGNQPHQQSFYYSGLGTRGNWFKRIINSAFAPSSGEMKDILLQASNDIKSHYRAGDEIYIFGFSRGAAIARIFAAKLGLPIKFLGVFDTVSAKIGALDLDPKTFPSSRIVFENDILAEHIEKAVHLVAIDEQRVLFQPTLFNQDSRVKEVWFSGAHSDIGGGYLADGLSDICLSFMLNEIKNELEVLPAKDFYQHTLLFNDEHFLINPNELKITPQSGGEIHSGDHHKKEYLLGLISPRVVRVNVNQASSPFIPIIHHSVIERMTQDDSYRPEALKNKHYNVLNAKGQLSDISFSFDIIPMSLNR